MRPTEQQRNLLCSALLVAGGLILGFSFYLILHGFPTEFFGIRLKNLKKPSFLLLLIGLLYYLIHPKKDRLFLLFNEKIRPWLISVRGIWLLFGASSVLLSWRQISEYLAVKVNFIPFMYYPAMLQRFVEEGLFNFTGQLHGFYHLNNIVYFLAPIWKIFPDPLLFVWIHGPLLASAVFPLFWIGKHYLGKNSVFPWFVCLLYLNYSFLDHLQFINFGIESFYPVLLLALIFFGLKQKTLLFFLMLFLALLVKEDAFVYTGTVGLCLFFMKGRRLMGISTMVLSLVYALLMLFWFLPWTGNTILEGNLNNFSSHGSGISEIMTNSVLNPQKLLQVLFGDTQKIGTYLKLVGPLLFIPLFSPFLLAIFPAIILPFMHETGRDQDFWKLHFHYAAPVIPFIFIALTEGMSRLFQWLRELPVNRLTFVKALLLLLLLFFNLGKYRSVHFTQENLISIEWARNVPPNANLVTHGHLLPYVGKRPFNYYFARPWTAKTTAVHREFMNADHYLFDYNIDLYPWTREQVEDFQRIIDARGNYKLVRSGGERFVYERIHPE